MILKTSLAILVLLATVAVACGGDGKEKRKLIIAIQPTQARA